MNNVIKNTLGILSSFLILLLLGLVGLEIKNRYNTPLDLSKTRTVTMTAEGKVTAKPDTANVSFSVVTTGKTADEVQKTNDQKMAKVIEYLKSKGVKDEDIQTANYNLYPQYNYNKPSGEQPEIVGYNLNQMVTVKVRNLNTVQDLVGGLTSKGVNQIDNLSFFIDDPDTLKAKARADAIKKARAKAEELATGLNVKLGRVVNFSEGFGGVPVPYYADSARFGYGGAGGAGGSPVQPGSQDITVNVTLTFELK